MSHRHIYDHRGSVVRELIVEDPTDFFSPFTTVLHQDVEPILERNAAIAAELYADGRATGPGRGSMTYVGTMPIAEAEKAMREGWLFDDDALTRFFNNSDNARLRVWGGRL